MFRKQKEQMLPTATQESAQSAEQKIADELSYTNESGRYWPTRTYRDPNYTIRLGEEMEQRQRGYTLVIPHGNDATVFEVFNNSPFSGYQHFVKNVHGEHPTVKSASFLQNPNQPAFDIPVGQFGFVKQVTQLEPYVAPSLDQEYVLELGELTEEQKQEMHLVQDAINAVHAGSEVYARHRQ